MPALDPLVSLGVPTSNFPDRTRQVNLLLLANGLPAPAEFTGSSLTDVSRGFLESHAEQQRLLDGLSLSGGSSDRGVSGSPFCGCETGAAAAFAGADA